jgi:hypothetical protein
MRLERTRANRRERLLNIDKLGGHWFEPSTAHFDPT